MKVSGFTFVRNAVQYDYPVVEAITSILPLCDEFIVALGNSTDSTRELIQSIDSPKIKIIDTIWDDALREGGQTFAIETNKAFENISPDADWAFYIQADEVVHEKYHENIRLAMNKYKDDKKVEGLLFNYIHFYGSYDYLGDAYRWYRREVRIIKNDKSIASYKDAQGFRKKPNIKINVKLIDAYVYHYGWVRDPRKMQGKRRSFNHFYFDDEWIEKNVGEAESFDYSEIDALRRFEGTHPIVMQPRIEAMNWQFDHDISRNNLKPKDKLKRIIEKWTGWRMGEFRNYKII
ncbi:MAG TPA: glycosyltransferase family 2 protein [Cyclobacteriaceae bacterium]|nr:glycosyltransferase family 2 protein [Cyclobacteriaceae bacterium]HRK53686.1 glycosyltransferase family 2 protein [Cyclobacteriaceae bacterium]